MSCPFASNNTTSRTRSVTKYGVSVFSELEYRIALAQCKQDLRSFIEDQNCNPILVRLAWHDSGTFQALNNLGGANGSIRFTSELNHGANAGLSKAMKYISKFKVKVRKDSAFQNFHLK